MKVVVNRCYGGFSTSVETVLALHKTKCPHIKIDDVTEWNLPKDCSFEQAKKKVEHYGGLAVIIKKGKVKILSDSHREDGRSCPFLVEVVEKLGSKKASNELSKLQIVEIPDGVDYEISDYDGQESIHEIHRSW